MRVRDDSPLRALGWDAEWEAAADATRLDAIPGRVARVDFSRVTVLTEAGSVFATPGDDAVATGDWVLIANDRVAEILPRRTAFVRGDPMEGKALDAQLLAANVDVVFIVQALTNTNIRRLERELVLSYESGATPVVVLTKIDLAAEQEIDDAFVAAAEAAPGVDVVATSTVTDAGIDALRAYTAGNRTITLIGASGVGKSTLVNALVGDAVQATGEVREGDQRGRHTTTARELVLIPGGGVLIDTPGLRAVSLWDADEGLSRAFADIEELALTCKFNDCSHTVEPGCAILAAIERGELDAARFEHYQRLDAELDQAERRRQARILSKAQKQLYKRS